MKVYKYNNKLAVYLPYDVADKLGIGENDDVDFFAFNEKAFLFVKKSEIAEMITGSRPRQAQEISSKQGQGLNSDEIAVLKKLDQLRYQQRTEEKIKGMLDEREKRILQDLIKKKAVSLFNDKKGGSAVYSITREVYDRFLMRKKPVAGSGASSGSFNARGFSAPRREIAAGGTADNDDLKSLREKGFVVVQTEGEASAISLALEDSIRHGQIIGTRGFNKKFYIITRQFFDGHNRDIIKAIGKDGAKTDDAAAVAGIEEEAARGILYLLAENGDLREKRRDFFTLA